MAMENDKHIRLHSIRNQRMIDLDRKGDEKYLGRSNENLRQRNFILSSIAQGSMRVGVYEWKSGLNKENLLNRFRFAHLARTWHWKAMQINGQHLIRLPEMEPLVCGQIEGNSDVDLSSWLQGIYIAMILRDIEAVKVYSQADPEKITRYGQNKPDPWEIPYIKFLNGIWAFDTQLLHHLKAAMLGCDPKLYNPERADYLLNIISPVMELWVKVLGGDEAAFNEGLYQQQKIRHDWHEALGEESGNSIMEYIDLAALAAVCYAHDKGMKVEVKSDYLPEFLINGDFPKLEWPDPEWKA